MSEDADFVFDQTDVLAQFFFAEGDTDEVRVATDMGHFVGSIHLPNNDSLEIHVRGTSPHIIPGATVHVDREGRNGNYGFYCEVQSVWPAMVCLSLPRVIQLSERRCTPRVQVSPVHRVRFHVHTNGEDVPLEVVDLSTGGIRFRNHTDWDLRSSTTLYGDLQLGSLSRIPARFEVRHAHETEEGRIVGGRLFQLSLRDRSSINGFIANLICSGAHA